MIHSCSSFLSCILSQGASIYDVRTEGGRGVPSKADKVIKLSKGGCVNLQTRGGGGPKIRKFCGRHMCIAPKNNFYRFLTFTATTKIL